MPSVSKFIVDGYECHRLTDKSAGRNLRYSVKLDKYTARQWVQAHNSIMQALTPEQRKSITGRQIRELAAEWLSSTKRVKLAAMESGLDVKLNSPIEKSLERVFAEYISDFCQSSATSKATIARARCQCNYILDFFAMNKITLYSEIKREHIAAYPAWRECRRFDRKQGRASADTINKELMRLGAIIRHGVKHCGWQERYLLDDVKVRKTKENTKTIRPFEINEVKTIMGWLRNLGNWHLHDMVLLALCSGLEAKALTLLKREWFKMDLGILRVYDKLVSGVLDAKTQNRARDIPLTPTMRKIYERGYIFKRQQKRQTKANTSFNAWSENQLRQAERETGIKDINLHRFRHTCATARLSAGWQLVRVSRMLGHSNVNTTASHYAEYDLSASPAGFEGMLRAYGEFVRWLDEGYFG